VKDTAASAAGQVAAAALCQDEASLHRSTPMDIRHCLLPMALALLAGCGSPRPPETERRPDPQAAAPAETTTPPGGGVARSRGGGAHKPQKQ